MESLTITSLDQALNKGYHQRDIMKQPIDSKCRVCYKAEHTKHKVAGAQHLCHLNTLLDTIRLLVTSTGRYVNICYYRLLVSTTNVHRKGS